MLSPFSRELDPPQSRIKLWRIESSERVGAGRSDYIELQLDSESTMCFLLFSERAAPSRVA
jgi:hypothetical protein